MKVWKVPEFQIEYFPEGASLCFHNSKYSFVKVITFPLPRVMKNYAK